MNFRPQDSALGVRMSLNVNLCGLLKMRFKNWIELKIKSQIASPPKPFASTTLPSSHPTDTIDAHSYNLLKKCMRRDNNLQPYMVQTFHCTSGSWMQACATICATQTHAWIQAEAKGINLGLWLPITSCENSRCQSKARHKQLLPGLSTGHQQSLALHSTWHWRKITSPW